jgi:hypothetical protein
MVEYITYKGQQLPIRISYMALKAISKSDKIDNLEDILTADISVLEILLYQGLRAGHHFTGIPMTIQEDEMEFILDEVFADFVKLIPVFIQDLSKLMGVGGVLK